MPYLKDKYVTICDSCNKPIMGESKEVKSKEKYKNEKHKKTWIYHYSVIDCAYGDETPLEITQRGAEGWIGIKSRYQ